MRYDSNQQLLTPCSIFSNLEPGCVLVGAIVDGDAGRGQGQERKLQKHDDGKLLLLTHLVLGLTVFCV